ncbi:MAG: hypothetical protein AABZ47_07990 [Planctomycetota bacterium]
MNAWSKEAVNQTLQSLRQHQLVILRRLRNGPLTEFELIREVAANSGFPEEQCADHIGEWLEELRVDGLVWSGTLTNTRNQKLHAAALTQKGRDLVD